MNRNCLDFLRLIFASLVVIWHIADLSKHPSFDPLLQLIIPYAYAAVNAFFVVSGFLIIKSYDLSNGLAAYLRKRANRLLPAYMVSVLLFAIGLSALSTMPIADYFQSKELYKYLGANLTFLNFLHPCLPGVFSTNPECSVNVALWTIKVEVMFYLTLPMLAYVLHRSQNKAIVLLVVYVLSITYRAVLLYLDNDQKGIYEILSRQLPGFMSYFASGMALYYYFDYFQKNKAWLAAIALPVYAIEWVLDVECFRPITLAIMVFYVAFSLPSLNSFGRHGDYSYGAYVFHAPILQIFIALGLFSYNPWIGAGISLMTIAVVAMLSWKYIEKPRKKPHTILHQPL